MKYKLKPFLFIISIIACVSLIFIFKSNENISQIENIKQNNASAKDGSDKNSINDTKIIYLTFDDGPNDVTTDDILNVLKKYNVKATFFIVGKEIKGREEILKRIHLENHGIGLHTYSHDFKKIYKSEELFIKEMCQTADYINTIIGIKPNLIRFPGGSHKRLNDDFLKALHRNNFKVFDWTNDSKDGVNAKSSIDKLYKNSLNRIVSHRTFPGVILLMHTNHNNQNTCKVLPKIIEHYKKEGYEFKVLSNDTPEYISE